MTSLRKSLLSCAALAAFASLSFGAVTPAHAEMDMANVTCNEITSEEEAVYMVFWLDGYLSAESGDTTLSDDWINTLVNELHEACAANSNARLLDIARNM